ncbi:MAG: Na/Pi cotransporter family protein, partial [Christensenellales bacterium]
MLTTILEFIAGLGIFLFAVKILGGALERLSSVKIKKGLNKLSKNRFAGIGFGTLMAFVTQSSLASVVMTMSFADSFMLTFLCAIPIIFGCNIGTSLSTILVSLNSLKISNFLAVLTLIGALMATFFKNKKLKDIGTMIASFGMFFVGLNLLSGACSVFKTNEAFLNFFTSLNSGFLYFVLGVVITLITQSSTVTIAILISLVGAGSGFEVISLVNCAYAIYGSNVGTALTAQLLSISGGIEAKRVAFSHVLFNVFGAILFTGLTFSGYLKLFEMMNINSSFTIVLINIVFNVVTCFVLLLAVKPIYKLTNLIVKQKVKKEDEIYYLKNANLESQNASLNQLNLCVIDLIERIELISTEIQGYCEDYTKCHSKQITKKLDGISSLNEKVKNNLFLIQNNIVGEQEGVYFLQVTTKNIERIIRNYNRILGFVKFNKDNKISFTQSQIKIFTKLFSNLKIITSNVKQIVDLLNGDGDKKEYLE